MATTTRRRAAPNRGPAAGPDNRAALLRAARRLFAERGYHVPLSAIAREAGVGQGSLYRHFPSRRDLAQAILEQNWQDLAEVGTDAHDPHTFARLWTRVVTLMVEASGFVEVVFAGSAGTEHLAFESRLRTVLRPHLARAHAAGTVDPSLDLDDLFLVLRMVFGAVYQEPSLPARRRAAQRVVALIGRGLRLDPAPAGAHASEGEDD